MSSTSPPDPNVNVFNNDYWTTDDDTITKGEADKRYLRFPIAQGLENLKDVNINGNLKLNTYDDVDTTLNSLTRQMTSSRTWIDNAWNLHNPSNPRYIIQESFSLNPVDTYTTGTSTSHFQAVYLQKGVTINGAGFYCIGYSFPAPAVNMSLFTNNVKPAVKVAGSPVTFPLLSGQDRLLYYDFVTPYTTTYTGMYYIALERNSAGGTLNIAAVSNNVLLLGNNNFTNQTGVFVFPSATYPFVGSPTPVPITSLAGITPLKNGIYWYCFVYSNTPP